MKDIELTSPTAQRIYKNYIIRVKKCLSILSKEDKQEMLMEINSHIFEGLQRFSDNNEVDNLLTVIEKLGIPEDFLKSVVADKKMAQAVRTFNPKNIFQALLLNFKNGVIYSVFALLYLLLFIFIFFIAAKIVFPSKTGLFYLNDRFQAFGFLRNTDGMNEVLGFWFIPLVILSAIIFYVLITLLLRFTKKK